MKQLQSSATLIGPASASPASGIDSRAIQRHHARGPGILTAVVVFLVVGFTGALVSSILTEGAEDGLHVGATYQNEHELLADVPGHVILGSFHVDWPARVTNITGGVDGVEFHVNRTPHSYDGFPGREFLAINFQADKPQEMAIVLATKP